MPHLRTLVMVASLLVVAAGVSHAAAPKNESGPQAMPTLSEEKLLNDPQRIPKLVAEGALTVQQVPNPHWRRDACQACHSGTPTRASLKLRDTDINRLCNTCHAAVTDHSYIHPTGMPVPASMQPRLSKSFQQAVTRGRGTITCITCHDLPMTCVAERARERGLNPQFFRDGPYRDRSELCYRCHDPAAYARLNPHDQVSEDGTVREASCRICHDNLPDVASARSIRDVDFTVRGDLSALCIGCHPWVPHPGGFSFTEKAQPNHLVVPSKGVQQQRQRMEIKNDIVLPLDPNTGRVFCGTCHNPHARGVLRLAAANKGAEEKKRLRMQEMCGNCHDK
jgi:hypothetical protein